jgi:hypothetical protein
MAAAAAADAKPHYPLWVQLLAFVAASSGNVGLNLFNSWSLRAYDGVDPSWKQPSFHFPVFYTMFHMLFSSLASLLLLATCFRPPTGMPTPRQYWEYKHLLLPIALCTFVNNGLNNMSLTMVSLFVNQARPRRRPFDAAAHRPPTR